MPEATLECYAENGRLQFSNRGRLPSLVGKGSVAGNGGAAQGTSGWRTVSFDVGNLTPAAFVAVTPNTAHYWAFAYKLSLGGNSYRFFFITNAAANTMTYYVFDYPAYTAPAAGDPVWEIWDNSGNLVWQLGKLPMRVVTFFQQAINAGSLGDQSTSVPSGKTYAVAVGMRSGYSNYVEIGTPDGQPQRYQQRYRLDSVLLSGGTISASIQIVDQPSTFFTTVPATQYFGPRNMMVLDVTGY